MYDPIAVVGFSLKFPGEADSVEGFWDTIIQGRRTSSAFPQHRFDLSGISHPDVTRNGTTTAQGGNFLRQDITAFDAPFFSISATEAETMDPQQRLLLETTYHALDSAGIPMHKVSNSRTSVFTGSFTDDYKMLYNKDIDFAGAYSATGICATLNSNRISWFFNLLGNSITVDSACSSSLVALDLACKSLHSHDSNMSVVAGVNIMLAADMFCILSDMNMLSPEGQSSSFDESSNGYGRGEGVGVLIIKRLSDAINDGDVVRAVIRSTGSNSDGRTPGITQPKQSSQEALIRECYLRAGLNIDQTRYFESHGTGTPVGDPIEANAIGAVFGHQKSVQPLIIGAVKSNIGHLEGASGIAGIIKAILVLERAVIPPIAGLNRLNPRIDEELLNLNFPKQLLPWPQSGLRRASVNSFGYGGTNSHAILDDAFHFLRENGLNGIHCTSLNPPKDPMFFGLTLPTRTKETKEPHKKAFCTGSSLKTLVFSAADQEAIARVSLDYSEHLGLVKTKLSNLRFCHYLQNLAFTLAMRRSMLTWRAFITVDTENLDVQSFTRSLSKPIRANVKPNIAFIFTGQGAQWAEMGKDLLVYKRFLASLKSSEAVLKSFGCAWDLMDELLQTSASSRINDPELSQPICTALQLALIDLLRTCGILPDLVIGHSSGEIAAAYCTGAISAQAALKIAYARGICASRVRNDGGTKGAMMAVGLSAAQVCLYFDNVGERLGSLVIACYNGPKNLTISGPEASIDLFKSILDHDGVFARKLAIDVAYHSPRMAEVIQQYDELMADLDYGSVQPAGVSMVSTVSGHRVELNDLRKASYWVDNLVSPVLFTTAFKCINSRNIAKKLDGSHSNFVNVNVCIEIGPHAALRGQIQDILIESGQNQSIQYLSVLERKQNGMRTYLNTLGNLHCLGYPIDWMESNHGGLGHDLVPLCDLPEYRFDHSKSYFHESKISKGVRIQPQPKLDLLGKREADWNQYEAHWRHFLRLAESPWIEHHKINGSILLPAASMLVMAIEALKQLAEAAASVRGFELFNVIVHTAVIVPSEGVHIKVHVSQDQNINFRERNMSWRVFALIGDHWTECCHGSGRIDYVSELSEINNGSEESELLHRYRLQHSEDIKSHMTQADTRQLYSNLAECGYGFGTAFQSISDAHFSDISASANIDVYRWIDDGAVNHRQDHIIHPCTLDGLLQLPMVSLSQGGTLGMKTLVPTAIRRLWVLADGVSWPRYDRMTAVAQIIRKDNRGIETRSSALIDDGSELGVVLEGVRLTFVTNEIDEGVEQDALWNMYWKPDVDLLSGTALQDLYGVTRDRSAEPLDFYQKLTFLLYAFLHTTLQQVVTMDTTQMPPHFIKYLSWAKMQLQKHHSSKSPGPPSTYERRVLDAAYIQSVLDEIADKNAEAKIFLAVGYNLPKILDGRISILDMLFQTNLAHDWYEEVTLKSFDRVLDRYLDLFSHKYPSARYLEVGGGTGGSTLTVLQSLLRHQDPLSAPHMYQDYTFTDISESFFEKARERFKDYPNLIYKRFDIETSPTVQGFKDAAYDCIIAVNVVHATASLATTLRNLHTLLRPRGKLILLEITSPTILRTAFITGLLPGWWVSSEDYRSHGYGPCLEPDAWHRVLLGSGFSGVDMILRDYESDECQEVSFMVTTKITDLAANASDIMVSVVTAAASPNREDLRLCTQALVASGLPTPDVVSLLKVPGPTTIIRDICIFFDDTERPILRSMGDLELEQLKHVLVSHSTIIWVTQRADEVMHPDFALVDGLVRVLRREYDNTKFVTISLGPSEKSRENAIWHQVGAIALQSFRDDVESYEPAFEERDGHLQICRLTNSKEASQQVQELTTGISRRQIAWGAGKALEISTETPRQLDSIHFVEDKKHLEPLKADEIEVQVHAVGMNLKDAVGQAHSQELGIDCTGTITRVNAQECSLQIGERVCMSVPGGALKTYTRSKAQLVQRIPDSMSLIEGATILTPFASAWACLVEIARLELGESVLIHAAGDSNGQAAIQIAQHIGANIFLTAGSNAEKRLLTKKYGIRESQVLYSGDASFAMGIQRLTNGQGVDVVLHSLPENSLLHSWDCLAFCGRLVKTDSRDALSHSRLQLPFDKSATFTAFDLSVWSVERPDKLEKIGKTIMDLFSQGILHTDPVQSYSISEIKDVFKSHAGGKSDSNAVIEMTADAVVPVQLSSQGNCRLRSDRTYVIAGGLGGVGRCIGRWMVQHGARHLILLSRSGAKSDTAQSFIMDLEAQGANVKTPRIDIGDSIALSSVLKDYLSVMPPIKGCVQASMVLRDSLFRDMTMNQWDAAIKSKVQGSWNLHELLPQQMDFFICLSSLSGIFGLRAQSNYAAGNTYLDALARYRVAHGEKAVSIDLGAVESDGYLTENKTILDRLLRAGFVRAVTRSEIHGMLAYYCDPHMGTLPLEDVQVVLGMHMPQHAYTQDQDVPEYVREPLNRIVLQSTIARSGTTLSSTLLGPERDFCADFVRAEHAADAGVIAAQALAAKLARCLASAQCDKDADLDKPIHSFGVDSLLAIDLQRWAKRELRADIAVLEIIGGLSFSAIGAMIAQRSTLRQRP